ncbi:hypothetical protein GOP47_0021943 [Adiantum capillus-veneris]|uniref:TORTIFOLIA1/SINE1-2 N-terminal domain-containing protein n=1 Tax=Adiantum capillus-veneris TaxID=13818 RepID=A0A9D4U8D7_ADICA|nr:hypothetical protein GOP47_0021943 [Adiantum capillus-veneris]
MAKYPSSSSSPSSTTAHSSPTSPSSAIQLSLQLKQDLAMLTHKDPDTRRSSMEALKQFIEGELDARSMPGFLEQVSGETGKSSCSYAISLFEEVARVHKEATVPFIPRIMAAVLRTLASSAGGAGHANKLHQACAKVVASVARYAIKPASAPSRSLSATDILDSLCQPLLGLLSANVEPVAVGSATCLQAVIEAENWKLAAPELVHDVCSRSSISLVEKGKHSVAHMHLVRSLANFNAGALQDYAGSLLKEGVHILVTIGGSTPGSGSWQQRAAAAQLVGTVIGCVDPRALASELIPTTKALERCRLDKVATVRQAVGEALSVAKKVASKVDPLLLHDGGPEANLANSSPIKGKLPEPRKRGALKKNISRAEESCGSTISGNDVVASQESQCVSYASSPSSSITSISSSSLRSPSPPPTEKSTARIERSPLYPVKQSPMPLTSFIDKYMAETDFPDMLASLRSSDFKENTPFVVKEEDGVGLYRSDDLSFLLYSNGNVITKESDNDELMMGTTDEHLCMTGLDCDHFRAEECVEVDTLEADSCSEKDTNNDGWGKVLGNFGKNLVTEQAGQRHVVTVYNPEGDQNFSKHSKLVANSHGNLYGQKQQKGSCHQVCATEVAKKCMSAEDFLIFSTPRRLVRSLQSVSSTPDSKCSPERDQGLDLDCDALSESGWSVRDNPIAGDNGEDSPRRASVHGQRDMLTRSFEGPHLMGLLSEIQLPDEKVVRCSELAHEINSALQTSSEKIQEASSDVHKGLNTGIDRLANGPPSVCHETSNTSEEQQTPSVLKLRKSTNWSNCACVLGKIHFYVERLLFGTLLLVLAFAAFITILSCKGQHDLHRLVPT